MDEGLRDAIVLIGDVAARLHGENIHGPSKDPGQFLTASCILTAVIYHLHNKIDCCPHHRQYAEKQMVTSASLLKIGVRLLAKVQDHNLDEEFGLFPRGQRLTGSVYSTVALLIGPDRSSAS